jgi:hypothetical protein
MDNLACATLCVLLSVTGAGAAELGESNSVVGVALRGEEAMDFLSHAEIVGEPEVFDEVAITGPVRVTLTDGSRTLRAVFKHEDTVYPEFRFSDGREVRRAKDSYRHEIAAYELDRMLDLALVPPCVERKIESRTGSLCLWVEGSMTEAERRERGLQPPDPVRFKGQLREVELFQQLIADLDYSDFRNLIIDEDSRVHKVDSSMAFDADPDLLTGLYSSRLSRRLVRALEALDKKEMYEKLKPWLHKDQRSGLWVRRNRILKRAERLIADYGEEKTLY